MAENLKNILSNLSTDVDQETLLQYLNGTLTDEKKHEVEKLLLENDFANDALEGLQEMKNTQDIHYVVDMLNRDLRKRTQKKKQRRDKMQLKYQPWIFISILILLLLIVLSYFVLHKMINK